MLILDILMSIILLGFTLLVINEILTIVFKFKIEKLTNIPKKKNINNHNRNTTVSSHNSVTSSSNYMYDDDYYYHNGHLFNQKKFYSQGSHNYVGNDSMGRGIYKDDVTGKYVTVENNSNDIVDESYSPPYYTPDYNDDYYHNSYDYYNNDDSYIEHNYGFDSYDNYSDYYSDSLSSYMNDNY